VTVNAELTPDDRFYEWLLSDHPAAVHERARRRLDNQVAEAEGLARLRGWLAKIDHLAQAGQPLGDSVWRLAEQTRTWLIPNAEQRLADLTDTPDQVRVRRARSELETSQQVGKDPDYRYPARYLGTQAAHQLILPDPGARPYDPEERPALSDRTVKDLEAENSPFGFVRTQAVTQRARIALERAHGQQSARHTREDAHNSRPHRARDHWEAERER
jgi:hypothetical protein